VTTLISNRGPSPDVRKQIHFCSALFLRRCLALDGPVDGGSRDVEEFGEFGCGVSAGVVNLHEVTLPRDGKLWLLAEEAAFRFRYLHAFASSSADQIGFELSDHREHVEQQSSYGVERVMDGTADAEFDVLGGELVDDVLRVAQ
jgi:hypothetical protein